MNFNETVNIILEGKEVHKELEGVKTSIFVDVYDDSDEVFIKTGPGESIEINTKDIPGLIKILQKIK
jgi:hypothetical protein